MTTRQTRERPVTAREVHLPLPDNCIEAFEMHAKRCNKPVEWVIGKLWAMWIEGVRRPGSWEARELEVLLQCLDQEAEWDDPTGPQAVIVEKGE